MTDEIPEDELCDRFAELYPGAITDVMDDLGYMDQTLDAGINPVRDHMTVAGIGGVEVQPGDVLVGDVDGVVCVPADIAEEVLREAEELANTENHVRKAVREGGDPLEAYDEYGVF